MNCKEISELLLSYLDEEIRPEERGAIEAHLSACSSCREEMEALAATQRKLRQGLNTMAAGALPSPYAWATINERLVKEERRRIPLLDLAKSKIRGGVKRLRSRPVWQKALVSTLTVLLITGLCLVIPAMGSRKDIDFEGVLERMRFAYSQVHSYRYQSTGEQLWVEQPYNLIERSKTEGAYSSPDRSWWRFESRDFDEEGEPIGISVEIEEIRIGNKRYSRIDDRPWQLEVVEFRWTFGEDSVFWLYLDCLVDVKQLSDEKADGVNCLHYKGKVDMDEYVNRKPWPWQEDDEEANRFIELQREYERHMDTTIELLIGEDDYLIREYKVDLQNPYLYVTQVEEGPPGSEPKMTVTSVDEFYDYNEPVEIEPPI